MPFLPHNISNNNLTEQLEHAIRLAKLLYFALEKLESELSRRDFSITENLADLIKILKDALTISGQ